MIIPWVDAASVWRGPTDYIVSEKPSLFDRVSIAFRLPGEEGSANIGPPGILFFSLFLAAASRFALRVRWTWFSMVGLLSLTLIATDALDLTGLPPTPEEIAGFLADDSPTAFDRVIERLMASPRPGHLQLRQLTGTGDLAGMDAQLRAETEGAVEGEVGQATVSSAGPK